MIVENILNYNKLKDFNRIIFYTMNKKDFEFDNNPKILDRPTLSGCNLFIIANVWIFMGVYPLKDITKIEYSSKRI